MRKFEEEFLARNNANNRAAKKLDRDTSSKRGNSQPVQEPQSTNGPHDLSDDDTRLRDTVATSDSWREALALLKTIQEDKIHDDTYKIIVSRITSDGHPEEALDVVESMHRNGRSDKATKACYVAMIDECTTSKKYQVSLDILQCMRDKGHAIEASVYNPIIGACNNSREGATSLKLIEDMAREKVMPSLVSVNTTICALGRSGQWEDSVALLQKVEKQFGLKPDIVSYNTAIAGCVPARQWALALELITQAETDCTPNAITYNSCLSACGAAKEWELALALMERMKNNGVNPNARTYGAAIMACKVSRRWRETRTLFKQMIAEGLCPDAQAYSHVIAVACGIRQWKDALSMLRVRFCFCDRFRFWYSIASRKVLWLLFCDPRQMGPRGEAAGIGASPAVARPGLNSFIRCAGSATLREAIGGQKERAGSLRQMVRAPRKKIHLERVGPLSSLGGARKVCAPLSRARLD